MKLYSIEPQLGEIHNLLVDSRYIAKQSDLLYESVCNGLTVQQQTVVETIYTGFRPLIEVTLSPDQIQTIFKDVEAQLASSGSNKTIAGKIGNVFKHADNVISKTGQWLQNTTPVQNFDSKFEQLKRAIAQKLQMTEVDVDGDKYVWKGAQWVNTRTGRMATKSLSPELKNIDGPYRSNILKQIDSIGEYARQNTGKTAAVIGVLTAVAAMAAGPIGGAVMGQTLRGVTELIKGEKLSTAVGKGAKTAAIGALAGTAVQGITDSFVSMGDKISDILDIGIGNVNQLGESPVSTTTVSIDFDGPNGAIHDQYPLLGTSDQITGLQASLDAYNQALESGNGEIASQRFVDYLKKIADMSTDEHLQQMEELVQADDQKYLAALDKDFTDAKNYHELRNTIEQLGGNIAAISQGTASGVSAKNNKSESRDLTYYSVKTIFESVEHLYEQPAVFNKLKTFAGNLSNKITADKLATQWKKSGSSLDSDDIYKLLINSGVQQAIANKIFANMKLQAPSVTTGAAQPAPTSQSPQPALQPAQSASAYRTGAVNAPTAGSSGSASGSSGSSQFKLIDKKQVDAILLAAAQDMARTGQMPSFTASPAQKTTSVPTGNTSTKSSGSGGGFISAFKQGYQKGRHPFGGSSSPSTNKAGGGYSGPSSFPRNRQEYANSKIAYWQDQLDRMKQGNRWK